MIRVDTQKQVIRYSAIITVIAVCVPVTVVGVLLSLIPRMPLAGFAIGLSMAALIPLLIAPPIAYLGLNLLRMMTQTIDRVDAQIRFDALTGVFNRTHMLDQVRARQEGGPLMIVDADHFKRINDTHGHAAGDAALIILANAIAQSVGPLGMVGRLGGEEFAVFLPGVERAMGATVAQNICDNIERLDPLIEGKRIKLTVSIGCTMHPNAALIGKSLKLADDLLYQAKSDGRNRAVFDRVSPAMQQGRTVA